MKVNWNFMSHQRTEGSCEIASLIQIDLLQSLSVHMIPLISDDSWNFNSPSPYGKVLVNFVIPSRQQISAGSCKKFEDKEHEQNTILYIMFYVLTMDK